MAYNWANRAGKVAGHVVRMGKRTDCRRVPKRRTLLVALAVLVLGVLGLALFDGGQQEQRLIVQPVTVPEASE